MGSCISSQKSFEENAGNDSAPEMAKEALASEELKTSQGNTNETTEVVKNKDVELNESVKAEQKAVDVEAEKVESSNNLDNSEAKLAEEKKAEETKTEELPQSSEVRTIEEKTAEDVKTQEANEKTSEKGDEAKNSNEVNGKTDDKPSPWGNIKLPWL